MRILSKRLTSAIMLVGLPQALQKAHDHTRGVQEGQSGNSADYPVSVTGRKGLHASPLLLLPRREDRVAHSPDREQNEEGPGVEPPEEASTVVAKTALQARPP